LKAMKKIRVSNYEHLICRPFSLLRGLDFVKYEENYVKENARKLHEGEVDVALIPTVDFLNYGSYVGLDFGLCCQESSNRLFLLANDELHQLNTIYVHDSVSSSSYLLRMLLSEKWNVTPRIVPVHRGLTVEHIKENEGMLLMFEEQLEFDRSEYCVCEDIVTVWHEWTGLPFVFLIWATRPGVLTLKQHKRINEIFHLSNKAREITVNQMSTNLDLPFEDLEDYVPDKYIHYYLNQDMIAGFTKFADLSHSKNLIAQSSYRSATYTMLDKKTTTQLKEKSVTTLLQEIIDGSRISVTDGVRLAEEASLADLGLAADLLRSRLFTDRSITTVFLLDDAKLDQLDRVCEDVSHVIEGGVSHLLIECPAGVQYNLEYYEKALLRLSSQFDIRIEGFGPFDIIDIAEKSDLRVRDVVARLVTAGLDAVTSAGGDMLIDSKMIEEGTNRHLVADWLRTTSWVHRFGAKSSCCLRIGPNDSWESNCII